MLDRVRHLLFETLYKINLKLRFGDRLILGKAVHFRKRVEFEIGPLARVILGDRVFINSGCAINCLSSIEVGEGTLIGQGVRFYDHNHDFRNLFGGRLSESGYVLGPIRVGRECWIGSGATVLKGVEIGDRSIVGAGCIVYKSIEAGVVVRSDAGLVVSTYEVNNADSNR